MVICKSFISLRAYFFTFQFQATITARQASALRNGIFIVYLMRRISLSRPFPLSLTIVCRVIILELFKLLHSIHIPKKTILTVSYCHVAFSFLTQPPPLTSPTLLPPATPLFFPIPNRGHSGCGHYEELHGQQPDRDDRPAAKPRGHGPRGRFPTQPLGIGHR